MTSRFARCAALCVSVGLILRPPSTHRAASFASLGTSDLMAHILSREFVPHSLESLWSIRSSVPSYACAAFGCRAASQPFPFGKADFFAEQLI